METIPKIRAYVNEAQEMQDSAMDLDASATEARLEKTVRDLQARVEQQQAELEMLRSQSNIDIQSAAHASDDPRQKLQQLVAVKAAYQSLKPTATYLPPPGSILPSLLAARTIQQNITASKSAITLSTQEHALSTQHLVREEANLHDARLLTRALEARITQLRTQHHERSQKTPAQLARDLIAAKRAQKAQYDAATQRLGDAMNVFINDYLSSMLAAEELGGPVVGDMLHVEDDTLAAGFTKKGKAKSAKKPLSEKTRQKRIDQIWGSSSRDAANVQVGDAEEEGEEQLTEAEAADAEMRALIGNLFATLMGGGAGGKAYLQLQRDSAAARFLVRAKIAQFHPRDAMKLRLIDFGRELDD